MCLLGLIDPLGSSQVDLTSCPVGAATLRLLGECCPAVEQLRLGSRVTDETAGRWACRLLLLADFAS